MSSPHKDEALQSQPTEQVEGSTDPMEQAREVTKQVETGEASGSPMNKKLATTWSLQK